MNLGNGTAYVGMNPWTFVDPLGLEGCKAAFDWAPNEKPDKRLGARTLQEIANQQNKVRQAQAQIDARLDTWGESTRANRITGAIDAARPTAEWGVNTTLMAATAFTPGPEDAVIAGVGASKIAAKVGARAGELIAALKRRRGAGDDAVKAANRPGTVGTASPEAKLDIVWPPNRGFLNPPEPAVLKPGSMIDRFGSPNGTFASPRGTPFDARSLPEDFVSKPLNAYEVVKPINVHAGISAPWFGQPGGGVQYELPQSIQELVDSGHLRKLENCPTK